MSTAFFVFPEYWLCKSVSLLEWALSNLNGFHFSKQDMLVHQDPFCSKSNFMRLVHSWVLTLEASYNLLVSKGCSVKHAEFPGVSLPSGQ